MTVPDFVCDVLKVPISLDGYAYMCEAIAYMVKTDKDLRFYTHLMETYGKSYSCIEKSLRLAKTKALESMSEEEFAKIFPNHSREELIRTKEFLAYAVRYFRKES